VIYPFPKNFAQKIFLDCPELHKFDGKKSFPVSPFIKIPKIQKYHPLLSAKRDSTMQFSSI